MNKLTIINNNGTYVVDSREVANKIEKRHDHLIRDIDNYMNVLENPSLGNGINVSSEEFFIPSTYKIDGQSKNYKCYLITKKGCDMVANKMTGEKGVLFTATYVNTFDEMESQLKNINLPSNYLEALKALVCSEEEKLQLQEQNNMKQKLIEQKEEIIVEMKPKVEFTDRLLGSDDSLLVREYSKVLQKNGFNLGQNDLFKWFRRNGYLMNDNFPYQQYMKYFEVIERPVVVRGQTKLTYTPKVNTKGQLYFFNKIKKEFVKHDVDFYEKQCENETELQNLIDEMDWGIN